MKKLIILLFSLFSIPISIFAQEQDTLKSNVETISDIPAKAVNIDSLQQELKLLQGQIEQYKTNETTLKGKVYDYQQEIQEKNAQIDKLKKHLIFADTIVARLSNDCLRKKYDMARANQAVANFEQMYSPELKSKLGRLKFLLNEYGKYTEELKLIFVEAQNDKALGNPFTGQKRAMTYIDKIKQTSYYKDVYNDNWTIPYLNKLIDKCFETIKSFNPRENNELHLLDLMN